MKAERLSRHNVCQYHDDSSTTQLVMKMRDTIAYPTCKSQVMLSALLGRGVDEC